jgi:hypothetical protein
MASEMQRVISLVVSPKFLQIATAASLLFAAAGLVHAANVVVSSGTIRWYPDADIPGYGTTPITLNAQTYYDDSSSSTGVVSGGCMSTNLTVPAGWLGIYLALLRHYPKGANLGRDARERARWQNGQRGSQEAIARAMASRTVMKLSSKCRSGRDGVRVARSFPGGRGGEMPRTFGDDERVAA